MDDWEIKVLLSEIGHFHSHLNMADISNTDYMHAKCLERFSNKKFIFHKLYVQSDTLLLAYVFENI